MSDREPDRRPILASDAERERAVARLRDAVGEGRLTLEEFTKRVGDAQLARTDHDLAALQTDLPAATAPAAPAQAAPATTAPEHRALFSHIVREGHWRLPARSSWRSIFGTVDLDLRQAQLESADTTLRVHNLFGTVTVIVPEGVEVEVQGGGPWASQKVQAPAEPPVPGGPRVTIELSGPGGTLYVRQRPRVKSIIKRALTGE